jgi:hypothetical protein
MGRIPVMTAHYAMPIMAASLAGRASGKAWERGRARFWLASRGIAAILSIACLCVFIYSYAHLIAQDR